jgi:hypothetical protein
VFDLAQPWEDRLWAIEEVLDAACKEEVRDTQLRASLRLDPLLRAVDREWESGDSEAA